MLRSTGEIQKVLQAAKPEEQKIPSEKIKSLGKKLIETAKEPHVGINHHQYINLPLHHLRDRLEGIQLNQADLDEALKCQIQSTIQYIQETPGRFAWDTIPCTGLDYLLEMKADINYEIDNQTALISAIRAGQVNLMLQLLKEDDWLKALQINSPKEKRKIDINHVTESGETALYSALASGNIEIINRIFEEKPLLHYQDDKIEEKIRNYYNDCTALMLVASDSRLVSQDFVEKILMDPKECQLINNKNRNDDKTALDLFLEKRLDVLFPSLHREHNIQLLDKLNVFLTHGALIYSQAKELYYFLNRTYLNSMRDLTPETWSQKDPKVHMAFNHLLTAVEKLCSEESNLDPVFSKQEKDKAHKLLSQLQATSEKLKMSNKESSLKK